MATKTKASQAPTDGTNLVFEDDLKDTQALVVKAWKLLEGARDGLVNIDNYVRGQQAGPYSPRNASAEYKLLIKRSISNWLPLVISAPAQCLYVENYTPPTPISNGGGTSSSDSSTPSTPNGALSVQEDNPLWDLWQQNKMDARQAAIYRAALQSGEAFVMVEKPGTGTPSKTANSTKPAFPRVKTLSPLRSQALWFDPANDESPAAFLTVDILPDSGGVGRGRFWDDVNLYTFDMKSDGVMIKATKTAHGFSHCPIVSYNVFKDLEGRTTGIIEHLIPIQDRINQTIFDLLIAQTYGSFKVRYATGLTPPPQRERVEVLVEEVREDLDDNDPMKDAPGDAVYGHKMQIIFDESGKPLPAQVSADATRFIIAADPEAKFGQLDETPLGGYIESIGMSVHHMAAIAQVPPHHLLGNLANLSADALAVAESSLFRFVSELQHGFGESHEQLMALLAEAQGIQLDNLHLAEVSWRDMSARSFGAIADGLSKLAEALGIPKRGLWKRVPGVTATELSQWDDLADQEVQDGGGDPRTALGAAINKAGIVPPQNANVQPVRTPAPAPATPPAKPGLSGNPNPVTVGAGGG